MEDLAIGIQNDFGEYDSFYSDKQILEGLYFTGNSNKAKENCNTFNIEVTHDKPTKISKRDNVVILSLLIDKAHILQFLIGNDLDLKKLELVSDEIVPNDIKKIIIDAFQYTSHLKIRDFLK